MAIRVEDMVARPPSPDDIGPPIEISAEQALAIIRDRIRDYADEIPQIPISEVKSFRESDRLIRINDARGLILSFKFGYPGYLVDRVQLQDLTIEAMREFGLDTDISYEFEHHLFQQNNGTISEHTVFPSQSVNGLSFVRWLTYIEATGDPVDVEWSLEDGNRSLISRYAPTEATSAQSTR